MRPIANPSSTPARSPAPVAPASLEIHYEPLTDLRSGEIIGAEALLRRRMPSGVVQIAARFLPLAESTGLLVEIGRRVLDRACGSAAAWQAFRRGTSVTVNLSARQLADPALPGWIEAVLTRHALRSELLILDIPEIVLAEAALDGGVHLQHLHAIADMGVRIAVDDAGTGPAAPSYLPSVPVSILKIDGRVVRAVRERDDARLAGELIALAHQRGLLALAEGLEQDEDVELLAAMDCDLGQGYAIGRGTSPDQIATMLG